MTAVCISIPGDPRGKGRPRFSKGRTYTDAKTASYENLIGWAGSEAMRGAKPLDGPLCVTISARFAPVGSVSRKVTAAMISGEIPPAKRPDIDNLAKSVLDGLNRIVWLDDAQVVSLYIRKLYAETPGLDIVIRPYLPACAKLAEAA